MERLASVARQYAAYPDADAHAEAIIDAALTLVDEDRRWQHNDARSVLVGAGAMLAGDRDEERRARQRAAELHISQNAAGRLYVTDADGRPVTDRRHFDTRAALAECNDIRRMWEQGISPSALARARAVLETYARFGLTRITPGNPVSFADLMPQIASDLYHAARD